MNILTKHTFVLAALGLLLATSPLSAGPLNPPAGPVASTGKTLTEVEPRTAIDAVNTPGDADSLFRITQPGSYYLTGNITGVANKHGIEIAADGVTIDLSGFQLLGVANALDGIRTDAARGMITVRNGTVGGWTRGINLLFGTSGDGANVSGIIASGNVINGILLPSHSIISDCVAVNTLQNTGAAIRLFARGVIRSCTANSNNGIGIQVGTGCTVSNCSTSSNVDGFFTAEGCVISGCSAATNISRGFVVGDGSTVSTCSARSNGADGFYGTLVVTFSECTAYTNVGDGIVISSACVATGNTCVGNGAGAGNGAGIHSLSLRNRIERNHCTNNDRGIDVDGVSSLIISNTCGFNGTDWDIINGNHIGPIVSPIPNTAPVTTGSYAGSVGTTDPRANITLP